MHLVEASKFKRQRKRIKETQERAALKEAITYVANKGYGSISGQTIREWCKNRGIGKRFGGRWLVKREALDKLLEEGF